MSNIRANITTKMDSVALKWPGIGSSAKEEQAKMGSDDIKRDRNDIPVGQISSHLDSRRRANLQKLAFASSRVIS